MPKKYIVTKDPLPVEEEISKNLALAKVTELRHGRKLYVYEQSLKDLNTDFGEIEEEKSIESILDIIRRSNPLIEAYIIEADDTSELDAMISGLKLGGGKNKKSRRKPSRKSRKSRRKKSRKSKRRYK